MSPAIGRERASAASAGSETRAYPVICCVPGRVRRVRVAKRRLIHTVFVGCALPPFVHTFVCGAYKRRRPVFTPPPPLFTRVCGFPCSVWLSGNFGHAYSRAIAQYVSDNRASLWEGQGEDTSMGIWIDEAPAEIKRLMEWVKSSYFTGSYMWFEGKCEDSDKFSIGHNISPKTMRKCYEMMDENEGAEEVLKALESKMELQRIATCGKRDCWRQGLQIN